MANEAILCQCCGIEAPTKFVEFNQNIGMLLARQRSYIKGNLCKSCVHSEFWKRTMITLGIGWLGTISLILAPIFIIMNLVHYLGALGMKPVPPGATKPTLNEAVINATAPFLGEIFQRINQGEPIASVARAIGAQAGVTPGQVIIYAQAVAAANRQQAQQPTYGFPVQPAVRQAPPPLPTSTTTKSPPPLPYDANPVAESPVEDDLGLR